MTRNRPSNRQARAARGKRSGRVSAVLGTVLALGLAACDTPVQVRGHVTDMESIESIKAGEYSQEDVLALLGTPSTVSTFDDKTWYYIGHRATQFAFQHPEVFERNVVVVSFDDTGFVREKQVYSLADGREIEPIARETPTEGRDFTILQQFLGNLGRLPGGGTTVPDIPDP